MEPKARREGLLVQTLEDETVIYDTERDRIHCLNPASALVYRLCDGRTSRRLLAERLRERFGVPADKHVVSLALGQLERARLLEARSPSGRAPLSRREVARRLGLVGGLAVVLPAVTSIVAPTPAAAATCRGRGGCCSAQGDCCPGLNCVGPRLCAPTNKLCL